MRIFLSAGEPSGDIHGANLIRALRELQTGHVRVQVHPVDAFDLEGDVASEHFSNTAR